MKQIRCLGILLIAGLTLFTSTSFGEKPRKFTIKNRDTADAYCAYAYIDATESTRLEYHITGWVRVPSGRAVTIRYASKYQNLSICIRLADGALWRPEDTVTAEFNVPVELTEDRFKVIYGITEGTFDDIHRYTSVDEEGLKTQIFYSIMSKRRDQSIAITIPGLVAIKAKDAIEIVEADLAEERALQQKLQKQLASTKATRNDLMQTIKHLDQRIKEIESLLNVPQRPKTKFDGVYDTHGFVRQGKDYALLFATNEYEHWNNLSSPIKDVEELGSELEKYGFEVDIKKNVESREKILETLVEYAQKDYQPGDQLFVYFAGHGDFSKKMMGGYIAASNSVLPQEDPAYTTYLSYARLKQDLDRLTCARILLVLDVSYGGTFDDNIALGLPTKDNVPTKKEVPANGYRQRLDLAETLKVKTRWYLSSGGKELILDGQNNSPFALALLLTLNGSNSETLADGVLTIPEIEQQLDQRWKRKLTRLRWLGEHSITYRMTANFSGGKRLLLGHSAVERNQTRRLCS